MKTPMTFLKIFIIFQLINIFATLPFLGQYLSFLSSPILKSIINKKNISLESFYNNNYHNNTSSDDDIEGEERNGLKGKFISLFRNELIYANINNISDEIVSAGCKKIFNKYLFGHIDDNNPLNISYMHSNYHMIKLLDDSSKTKNYLNSYDQCMIKKYKYENYATFNKTHFNTSTYVVITYDKTKTFDEAYKKIIDNNNENTEKTNISLLDFESKYYLIAFCLPQGNDNNEYCNDTEYGYLINYINIQLGDPLQFYNEYNDTIEAFSLTKNPVFCEKDSSIIIFVKLLPFIFFACQTFFVIFRNQIIFIFQKIYFLIKKPKNEIKNNKIESNYEEDSVDNDDDNERVSYIRNKENNIESNDNSNNNEKLIYKITNCFCFTENVDELFNFTLTSTKYNNDSGLSNLRGIRGISIFVMIVGWTFIALYNSPSKIYTPFHLKNFFQFSWGFSSIVMVGARYSPRVIISCSGYILVYKYISYLNKNISNNSIGLICIKFIIYQSYKYILLFLLLLFLRYSFYHIFTYEDFVEEIPIWKFFYKKILSKPDYGKFFFAFSLIKFFGPNLEEESRNGNNLLHYFWLPFNEIAFFIIGILIMTIGFKKKYRFDIFILISILIMITFKLLYSYLIQYFLIDKDEIPLKKYYPTYYFTLFNYGRFMMNPLFNLPYFLIGMYFGLMNYSIQKGILKLNNSNYENKKELDNESSQDDSDYESSSNNKKEGIKHNKNIYCSEINKMPFLITPIIFVQWHRRQKLKYLLILLSIFFILFLFFIVIYIIYSSSYIYNIYEFFEHPFPNFIFRIDIEFVILFVHWGAFIIFLKANNFAAIFLSHIFWTMLSKPYFSFILVINTVLLFIFYHSETLIEINSVGIFLYSLIGGAFTFILTCLFYLFFELPYKRLTHLLCSLIINKNETDDIENDIKEKKDYCEEYEDEGEEELLKEKKE